MADWYGLPFEATRGGAKTIYPQAGQSAAGRLQRFFVCTVLLDCNLHAVPPAR